MKVMNGLSLQNQRITSMADPSSSTDAATKQYVDNLVNGLVWKQPVRVATTANGTLATAYANGQTVDGVTLTTGMRILLKDQTTGADNGIYTVNASGAPTRAVDADSTAELQNATVYVVAGTVNGDKAFTQTANDITVGTTAQTWVQSSGGTTYTNGTGLTLTGNTFAIDPAYSGLAKRFAASIGDGTSTSIGVTHSLGTRDVDVTVYDNSTFEVVYPDVVITSTSVVTVTFATAPASNAYRVVVCG